jgi:hypothetical protein
MAPPTGESEPEELRMSWVFCRYVFKVWRNGGIEYKNLLKFGIKTVRAIPDNARQFTSRLYLGFMYRFYDDVISNV